MMNLQFVFKIRLFRTINWSDYNLVKVHEIRLRICFLRWLYYMFLRICSALYINH
jgi:hypothetical protein